MKRHLLLLCLLCTVLGLKAQSWTFESWDIATYTTTTTKDGLTVYATEDKSVTVDENSKEADGISFTRRLKLGGSGKADSRTVTFEVTGSKKITIYAMASSSSATRTLCIATGSFDNVVSTTDLGGTSLGKAEYEYQGDATTIYVYSKSSGINLYGIYLTDADSTETPSDTTEVSGVAAYDAGAPIGWASAGGYECNGSQDQNAVTVTTLSELTTALKTARDNTKSSGSANMTIYVKGEIETNGYIYVQDTKGLTIYGLPGATLYNTWRAASDGTNSTGVMLIKRCQNLIIRNLTFKSAGAYDIDGNDNLTLQSSKNVWVDHCDFQDGVDGNFDISSQADSISVTWCRFRYLIDPLAGGSGGSDDHRFSDLIGSSDDETDDEGKLNITFADCWWDEGCVERMPRIRYGKIHLVNCLYNSSVVSYYVGIGYKAQVKAENCVFKVSNSNGKVWKYVSDSGEADHSYVFSGCEGISDTSNQVVEAYFVPADYYTLEAYDAQYVEAALTDADTGAGATLDIEEGQAFTTGINTVEEKGQPTVQYFNVQGMAQDAPTTGLNIMVKTYENGKKEVKKFIVK